MNTPKIEIKGRTATGKSSLAWAIKDALKSHGIECEVTGDENEDEVMEASWRQRIQSLSGKTVTIETIQLRPPLVSSIMTCMNPAITRLEIDLSTLDANEKIHREEGLIEIADREAKETSEIRQAINFLRRHEMGLI